MLQQYWAGQGSYTYVPVQQFSEAFRNSPTGQRNAEAMAQPYDKALHKKEALVHTKRSLTGVNPWPPQHLMPVAGPSALLVCQSACLSELSVSHTGKLAHVCTMHGNHVENEHACNANT